MHPFILDSMANDRRAALQAAAAHDRLIRSARPRRAPRIRTNGAVWRLWRRRPAMPQILNISSTPDAGRP